MTISYILVAGAIMLNAADMPAAEGPAVPDALYQVWDIVPEGTFTSGVEGPACDAAGNLYAVSYAKLTDDSSASGQLATLLTAKGVWDGAFSIGMVSAGGAHRAFVDLPEGSIANGIRLSSRGTLLVADYTGHNVLEIDPDSKAVTVFAHEPLMNQPNDLAITSGDILFASDPNWSEQTGKLWRIDGDGAVELVEEGMGTTNGVEVSPDEGTLYVSESVQRVIWQYSLSAAGEVSAKREFARFEDFGLDGMRCDVEGNLYVTRHGKGIVAVFAPDGQLLREVALQGKKPTNIAFGGSDGRICYVTVADRGCIEAFRTEQPGRSWAMLQRRR